MPVKTAGVIENPNPTRNDPEGFVPGMSAAMQTLENVVAEIADTDIPVLLVGESGTGKEVIARRMHHLSRRRAEPILKITCASLTTLALNSDLGLISNGEPSNGTSGIVLFDEIGELDAACQRSLVHALAEEGAGTRVRGAGIARVISTTSQNLDAEIHAGRFRSDLFYRINGVCLRLPPLRERKDDIPLLVDMLLTKYSSQLERPRPTLSPRAFRMLLDHSWPGNIRELENAIKKTVVLGDEKLGLAELESAPIAPIAPPAPELRVHSLKAAARAASREAERHLILEALGRTRWNRKRAAQELQISYKSLLYKLKQIGMPDTGAVD
jgi:DNA-binding NtrC family response regulator